jgi:hypothetical protein
MEKADGVIAKAASPPPYFAFVYTTGRRRPSPRKLPRYRRLDVPPRPSTARLLAPYGTGPQTEDQHREDVAALFKVSRSPWAGRYRKKLWILLLFLGVAGFTMKL